MASNPNMIELRVSSNLSETQTDQEVTDSLENGIDETQTGNESELPENPWPNLAKFLSFRKTDGNIHIFQCKLCLPKVHDIRAHKTSTTNIKSHFKKKHLDDFFDFEEACKAASNRGKKRNSISQSVHCSELSSPRNTTKQSHHPSFGELFSLSATAASISQACADKAFLNYFAVDQDEESTLETQQIPIVQIKQEDVSNEPTLAGTDDDPLMFSDQVAFPSNDHPSQIGNCGPPQDSNHPKRIKKNNFERLTSSEKKFENDPHEDYSICNKKPPCTPQQSLNSFNQNNNNVSSNQHFANFVAESLNEIRTLDMNVYLDTRMKIFKAIQDGLIDL